MLVSAWKANLEPCIGADAQYSESRVISEINQISEHPPRHLRPPMASFRHTSSTIMIPCLCAFSSVPPESSLQPLKHCHAAPGAGTRGLSAVTRATATSVGRTLGAVCRTLAASLAGASTRALGAGNCVAAAAVTRELAAVLRNSDSAAFSRI